jgi:uncharacterized OsmC-like protein
MVNVVQKTTVTMKLAGTCPSHARTDVAVRNLVGVIDEPTERGGTNQGLTPTETMMAALMGCTNVILSRIAEKAGVHIEDMKVNVEAQFDRRGTMLMEDVKVPFPDIKLMVSFRSGADDATVARLREDLAKFCPISKVLREAGSRIEEVWTVTRA